MEGNRMFKKPDLKQCPFCGSTQVELEYYTISSDENPYWQICCDHCGASSGKRYVEYDTINKAFEGYTQAIEKTVHDWNMRINDDKISVIRCRKCKWWNPRSSKCENEQSSCFGGKTFEEWFCADGELK